MKERDIMDDKISFSAAVEEINRIIQQSDDQINTAMSLLTLLYEILIELQDMAPDARHGAEFDEYLKHPEVKDDNAIDEFFDNILVRVAMDSNEFIKKMYKCLYKAIYKQEPAILPKSLPEKQMLLIEILGSTGKYEQAEIYQSFNEACVALDLTDKMLTDGHCLYHMNKLIQAGFVNQEKVAHPLKSQYAVYSLTGKGREIYYQAFGHQPVEPLFWKIIREHDNLEHGLGVITLCDFLRQSSEYYWVSCDRNETTLTLLSGETYIPDVVAKSHAPNRSEPHIAFFEYERNTHTQENFEKKMERSLQALRAEKNSVKCVYIVANNRENALGLSRKVDTWVAKRGQMALMSVKVRITTLVCIREAVQKKNPISSSENWIVSYDFQKGVRPKIIKPTISFNQKKSAK